MSHKKSILIVMAALSAVVLAGLVSVSLSANVPVGDRVNDKANHHPKHVNG